MHLPIRSLAEKVSFSSAVILAIFGILAHWQTGIYAAEIVYSVSPLLVLFALCGFAVSLASGWRISAIAWILTACFYVFTVVVETRSGCSAGVPSFRVAAFNMYHDNASPKAAIERIRSTQVDLLTIQELNANWELMIDSAFDDIYPFRNEHYQSNCCYGIGIFSKFPIVESVVYDIENTPVLRIKVIIENRPIVIYSLHTRPPIFPNEMRERDAQLREVASMAKEESSDCILLGDLNIVPWDPKFQEFLHLGGLNRVSAGFKPTYPMDLGFPLIPIDHITYSGHLVPTSFEAASIPGSDHRGLVAGFALTES